MGYSPIIGRFLQRDPDGYVDALNLYQLERGNPLVTTDPSGLQTKPTTGPTTGPTTNPGDPINLIVGPRLFQVRYTGEGNVVFKQTVQISACNCQDVSDAVRQHEKADHGGKDPFDGPVGDNASGDTSKPAGAKGARPNGGDRNNKKQMTDYPSFPDPYPSDFCGTKTFVTTVENPDGTVIKTIKWSVSQDKDGKLTYKQDQ